jgi:hypothetical protein
MTYGLFFWSLTTFGTGFELQRSGGCRTPSDRSNTAEALGQGAFIAPPLLSTTEEMVTNLRVSPHEEVEGLDIGEHGNEAYHGFQMIRTE